MIGPIPNLNTLDHSFLSYAADKQTDENANGIELLPTPTDIVGVGSNNYYDDQKTTYRSACLTAKRWLKVVVVRNDIVRSVVI